MMLTLRSLTGRDLEIGLWLAPDGTLLQSRSAAAPVTGAQWLSDASIPQVDSVDGFPAVGDCWLGVARRPDTETVVPALHVMTGNLLVEWSHRRQVAVLDEHGDAIWRPGSHVDTAGQPILEQQMLLHLDIAVTHRTVTFDFDSADPAGTATNIAPPTLDLFVHPDVLTDLIARAEA